MTVSEFIFDYYSKKGIDTVFMVTGGQAMWLNDAIGRNNNYNIVCTHHEQSAAMSADAYGRIRNKPAITLVTAGPGAINALNGVVGGYTDSSPMIVISGQSKLSCVDYQEQTGIRQFGVQGIYIKNIVENVVKYFITVDDPQKIEYYLEKAYQEATTGRPGPVWIDVPLDIQNAKVNLKFLEKYALEKKLTERISIKRAIDHAYNLLENAKRPLLIVGQGVSLAGAREDFYNYINRARIPVITSRLGIDLIESDNPLYVGRPGNYGERAANIAIQNADLIISVGCRLSTSLVGHDSKQFGKNAYIYVVDIDQKELDKPGPNIKYKVKTDAKEFFAQMNNNFKNYKLPDFSDWVEYCNKLKKNYPVCLPEYKNEKPVNSYYFINELSKIADNDAVIMCDTGSCFHVACQTWNLKKGQNYLTTGGLSSMGYWVAGIGACLANDRKPTIVITGDGSLQMNIQEFATIKHNNLPIKIFILNNNGYLLIRHTQRNFMDNRFIGESPESGVWCPDAMKIANAYGIKGIRIEFVDEVNSKIKEALNYNGPVICEVMTPNWQMLIPRVASEKMSDGTLRSRNYEDMFPYLPKDELKKLMIAEKE